MADDPSPTIQGEASRIFHDLLLRDARLGHPASVLAAAARTRFDGSCVAAPFLPAPLKCSELSAALWALLGTYGNAIAGARYASSDPVSRQACVVSSDAASLFLFSFLLLRVGGQPTSAPALAARYGACDTTAQTRPWRRLVTNVYATADGRWFHLHGGLDSSPSLRMLGLPPRRPELEDDEEEEAAAIADIGARVARFDARWLEAEANDHWRQAGGICRSPGEYAATEHGRAEAGAGLYTVEASDLGTLPAVPWPAMDRATTKHRPLEGIKLVDLTRAIAGPTMARLAALLGARVVRVSNTALPDIGIVLFESNLGKRDAHADLKTPAGREALARLVRDADVVLDGYRPGVLERLGFGPGWVHEVGRRRGRGVVYARENCHGWRGEWRGRSGWQQVSDAVTGVGWLFGRFWGGTAADKDHDDVEPVMPFLPNSDFQTGIVGCVGILNALDRRARDGGNYLVSTSLNQLNCFLISLGEQSPAVQRSLRERWPEMKPRHYDDLHRQMRVLARCLPQVEPDVLHPRNFRTMKAELGVEDEDMTFVGPAVTYDTTILAYDSGSCLRGMHKAEWPDRQDDNTA
ncbi:CAIB/BAIF family enzyme [Xylariomycetidae sp. FL0641]|nr:CAIB/BAIF family enzyme [Xylariomycetidae sp. FL0641]